jgi:Transposase DDE domain
MKAARQLRPLQQPRSLMDFARQFLTPQVFKQARRAVPRRRPTARWDRQPLPWVALAMTWAAGDSREERFVTARGFYVASHEARKRPGKTLQGFQKALSRLPMRTLRAFATGVRTQIRLRFAERLLVDGFEPMGRDGSRLECPRSNEWESRLRPASKDDCAPTVWLTALVPLGTGLLWSWRLGPGTADERPHPRQLLETLAPAALIVADAASMGYDLAWAIPQSKRSFLPRLSSNHHLDTKDQAALPTWSDGPVSYWPKKLAKKGKPPLPCRLIRVPAQGQAQHDVWLLTNILDPAKLSAPTAAKFYRWRWRNEGLFRIYKRTISKMKLTSRTVRLIHREAEVSLLALQVLLAHADLALRTNGATPGEVAISPRKVLLAIRTELQGDENRRQPCDRERLKARGACSRRQTSPKERRAWPRRKPHKPPGPPVLHTLDDEQKALLHKHLNVA